MGSALKRTSDMVKKLKGRTAVVLFSDGTYSQSDSYVPWEQAKWLLKDSPDACLLVISSAKPRSPQADMLARLVQFNACSRVVPFDDVLDRPEFIGGVLFSKRLVQREILTVSSIVVGMEVDTVRFAFNSDIITADYRDDLDALGRFLQSYPPAYVMLSGYTDNIGSPEYNMGLSGRRAEAVKQYLAYNYKIQSNRLVANWFGMLHSVASNDTDSGRAANRRVEIEVEGLD